TMQIKPKYGDVLTEVKQFFFERFERLKGCGMREEQIIIDPGFGFGKTAEHNLQLLAGLSNLTNMGRPVLLGVSRKSFIRTVLGAELRARTPAALACATLAVEAGVQIVRAHDVAATVQTIRM